MNIDKIYIISLNPHDEAVQAKVLEGLQKLNFDGPTGYEIHHAHDGHTKGVLDGYAPYSKWNSRVVLQL